MTIKRVREVLFSNVLVIRGNQSVYTSTQFGFFGVIFWEDSHSTSTCTCCHGDQTVWLHGSDLANISTVVSD